MQGRFTFSSARPPGSRGPATSLGHENLDDVWGMADDFDEFGFSLAAGYLNGDRFCDLAVGVPFESFGVADNPGVVNVFHGSPAGFSSGNRVWSQDSPGMTGVFEDYDFFGMVLAVMSSDVLFRGGFETGTTSAWSSTTP